MNFSAEYDFGIKELGLHPAEFWRLTPAELMDMAEGHSQKALQHRNELVFTAWHTAAFSRIDKLPSLESMIQKDHKQSQPQTDDEMMAMCRLLNAAFGGVEVDV